MLSKHVPFVSFDTYAAVLTNIGLTLTFPGLYPIRASGGANGQAISRVRGAR